jgi:hypothetical protein
MATAYDRARRLGLSSAPARALARLATPERIQGFVSDLAPNFEPDGDTCRSVAATLAEGSAHCIEAAFVAACAGWIHGAPPLLLDFQAEGDDDHVAALFRRWGAISKSNHLGLRWRDPIHRTARELALTYVHEYVRKGRKTLRRVSRPFDLRRLDAAAWVTAEEPCWDVAEALDDSPHVALFPPAVARRLRRRDAFERSCDARLERPRPSPRRRG